MITTDILYQIHCDACKKVLPNNKGGRWFKTDYEALGTARQYGWHLFNGKHLCTQCHRYLKRSK